ncbi:glycosyltransferase family 4 protein [Paenibacillus sp. MBLB4367]|uniref:glycosyltransferase family 4 protein n=1 Tax=Paenibacillus sp. MBLB4367 TaxID=3384767 RepID=UPI003908345E
MSRSTIMLFSHICYTDHITGAEKFLLFLLGELKRMHDCILVVPNEGILSGEARKIGIDIIVQHYPITEALWEPQPNTQAKLEQALVAGYVNPLLDIMHIRQPDAVVTVTCVNPVPAVAAKRLGIPVIWLVTEMLLENEYTNDAVAFMNQHSDLIVGISHTMLAPYLRYGLSFKTNVLYPAWNGTVRAGTNAVYRKTLRNNLRLSESEPLIAFIASDLVPKKGLEHFIFMSTVLSQSLPSARFLIVGNPTERGYYDACMHHVRLSGAAQRFFVAPFTRRIEAVLPAIDVLVMPSLVDEGFGMTALEGMMFEKAVAAYASGGLAELLTVTGNGNHLAPKGDAAALAKIVGILAADTAYRQAVGEASKAIAIGHFGITAYRERLKGIIDRIVEKAGAVKKAREGMPLEWPNGIVLMADSNALFLLEDGKKRPFASEQSLYFFGYGWERVVVTDHDALTRFPTGRPVCCESLLPADAPRHMLVAASDGSIYAVSDGIRHKIESAELLKQIERAAGEALRLPDPYLQLFAEGRPIDDRQFESGVLLDYELYVSADGSVFYAERQKLRPVESEQALYSFLLRYDRIVALAANEIASFEIGKPIRM